MKKIYKYLVNWGRDYEASVELPIWADIVDFEFQGSELYLWAIVDPNESTEIVRLEIYGTGWEIKDANELTHLKTVHVDGFVWHIFIRRN